MKTNFAIALLLVLNYIGYSQKTNSISGINIQIKSSNYKNNRYYLASHFGKINTLLDSVQADAKGRLIFKNKDKYVEGIYMIVDKDKKIVLEFLMDENQNFKIDEDASTTNSKQVENSTLNSDFKNFNSFFKIKMDSIVAKKEMLKTLKTKKDSLEIFSKIKLFQKNIVQNKMDYIQKNPKNTLSLFFRMTFSLDDLLANNTDVLTNKADTLAFLKKNYFKDIHLDDPRLLRTPFLDSKIDSYFDLLVNPNVAEVTQEVFQILDQTGNTEGDMFKYLSTHFIDAYLNSKIMGLDQVFLNIHERYFKNKNYSWFKPQQVEFLKLMEKNLKGNQIGNRAANLFMLDLQGKRIDLYDTQAPYTVVVFWDPTCSHCTATVPKIIATYNKEWKSRGVKVFAINNNTAEISSWKTFIEKEKLEEWINVYPPKQLTGNYTQEQVDFQTLYNVFQTPVLYLLDSDKKILAKKIGFENYTAIIDRLKK